MFEQLSPNKSTREIGQIAREAFVWLRKYHLVASPLNYTLAYCIVTQTPPQVESEIQKKLRLNNQLTELDMLCIYQLCFQENPNTLNKGDMEIFNKLLSGITQTVSESSTSLASFDSELGGSLSKLNQGTPSPIETQQVISQLISETKLMKKKTHKLNMALEKSQREALELKEKFDRASIEAKHDELTTLVNRRGLQEAFTQFSEHAEDCLPLFCLMLDIDHFKTVNDSYGHPFGDIVLQAVAVKMKLALSHDYVAARYGGEEFCILLLKTEFEEAMSIAENIRASVRNIKIIHPQKKISVDGFSVSIGMTLYQPHELFIQLIDRADKYLYRSKHGGRNRITSDHNNYEG